MSSDRLLTLKAALEAALGDAIASTDVDRGELTVVLKAAAYADAMLRLRDDPSLSLDYSDWKNLGTEGRRYAVVSHLLSVTHNWRLRVRVFCPDDDQPMVTSATPVWNSANWFEREAFDMYGIVFDGHLDLRRILTDYGFIGHPMRKDFPVSGHVEMRYDAEKKRVIYQPVTIEPRENVPRVVREDNYGGLH
jgi:NADH-quinone oxidoreductase subunit C